MFGKLVERHFLPASLLAMGLEVQTKWTSRLVARLFLSTYCGFYKSNKPISNKSNSDLHKGVSDSRSHWENNIVGLPTTGSSHVPWSDFNKRDPCAHEPLILARKTRLRTEIPSHRNLLQVPNLSCALATQIWSNAHIRSYPYQVRRFLQKYPNCSYALMLMLSEAKIRKDLASKEVPPHKNHAAKLRFVKLTDAFSLSLWTSTVDI